MLHTDIIKSIPAVADAYEKFAEASREQSDLGAVAARRHAEWVQEVATLPVGTVMPTEPSGFPTDTERSQARLKVHVTEKALEEAIDAHFDDLAALFRERERIVLAEVSELDTRLNEIASNVEDLIRDVIWLERTSKRHFNVPQTLSSETRALLIDVAHGAPLGANAPAGTFFQNL